MWAKRLPTHSNEKFHFLPSHICVISTRSPSCKVRPCGIDAPFNWLIAVETRNGKEHTFKNFSFIKQVQEFFFFFEGHDSLCYRCPSNRKYPLSLSLPLLLHEWRACYTSTRRDQRLGPVFYIQPPIDGASSNAPNYN